MSSALKIDPPLGLKLTPPGSLAIVPLIRGFRGLSYTGKEFVVVEFQEVPPGYWAKNLSAWLLSEEDGLRYDDWPSDALFGSAFGSDPRKHSLVCIPIEWVIPAEPIFNEWGEVSP